MSLGVLVVLSGVGGRGRSLIKTFVGGQTKVLSSGDGLATESGPHHPTKASGNGGKGPVRQATGRSDGGRESDRAVRGSPGGLAKKNRGQQTERRPVFSGFVRHRRWRGETGVVPGLPIGKETDMDVWLRSQTRDRCCSGLEVPIIIIINKQRMRQKGGWVGK